MEVERPELFKSINKAFFSGYYLKSASFVKNKKCLYIHKTKFLTKIDSQSIYKHIDQTENTNPGEENKPP